MEKTLDLVNDAEVKSRMLDKVREAPCDTHTDTWIPTCTESLIQNVAVTRPHTFARRRSLSCTRSSPPINHLLTMDSHALAFALCQWRKRKNASQEERWNDLQAAILKLKKGQVIICCSCLVTNGQKTMRHCSPTKQSHADTL